MHSRWYWKKRVSHYLRRMNSKNLLTHLVSQSDFLHWITFTFVSISTFATGLPHSQINKSSRFRVQRDLPTRVWGAAMEKTLSWFLMAAGLGFPSVRPGASRSFIPQAFWVVSRTLEFGVLDGLVFWRNGYQLRYSKFAFLYIWLTSSASVSSLTVCWSPLGWDVSDCLVIFRGIVCRKNIFYGLHYYMCTYVATGHRQMGQLCCLALFTRVCSWPIIHFGAQWAIISDLIKRNSHGS